MSSTARVLTALAAGLVFGVIASWTGNPLLLGLVAALEPIGALWINAIRMTVIPLVVSLLVTSIASTSAGSAGRIGGRALVLFGMLVAGAAIVTAFAAPVLLSFANFDSGAFAGIRGTTAVPAQVELPPFRDWIVGVIPANPIRAAADGTMLPLIVFSLILAVAITRLDTEHRDTLVRFFSAISNAMLMIVGWILLVAPVGVFFLVLSLAARTGIDLISAMGAFLIVACGLATLGLLALYPITAVAGGVTVRQFARACARPQAVAFSTRSSLISLPAMLEAAEHELQLPLDTSGIVLPVAVGLFKFATPIGRMTGTFFVAQLYGIDLGILEIATITVSMAALSFYAPGIPSGGLLVMTPIYVALGLPVEGIGLLIGLDLISDMFLTTANVTADMTVATILGRPQKLRSEVTS